MKKTSILGIAACLLALVSASCEKEEIKPEQKGDGTVVLNCVKPAYLMPGDTVALISPSYFTPMENVNNTADLLRSWGLVPVTIDVRDDGATLRFNIDGEQYSVNTTAVTAATTTPVAVRMKLAGKLEN